MLIDRHYERTGFPKERLPVLRGNLTRLIKYATVAFKVGVTTSLKNRSIDHSRADWPESYSVYKTRSYDHAVCVEDELIQWGWHKDLKKSWNQNRGGGGDIPESDLYWVYVLVD